MDSIEDIVATRKLGISHTDGSEQVLIIVGKPRPSDTFGYYCTFQIKGLGSEKIKYAKGVDGIDALQSAMLLIGADLEFLNATIGNKLRWEGDDDGDLGFPLRESTMEG